MTFSADTDPKTLTAINQILQSIGQAPVTNVDDRTNPDVAIILNTLTEVNKEVQAEGWAFNTEYEKPINTINNGSADDKEYHLPEGDSILQIDLSDNYKGDIDVVVRRQPTTDGTKGTLKLYDRYNHTYKLGTTAGQEFDADIIWLFHFIDVPISIQNYITSKTATIVAQRILGDPAVVQTLLQREGLARSIALEYECNQADYSIFGHPHGNRNYTSYKPYTALQR
jgi:hypothetical protein